MEILNRADFDLKLRPQIFNFFWVMRNSAGSAAEGKGLDPLVESLSTTLSKASFLDFELSEKNKVINNCVC